MPAYVMVEIEVKDPVKYEKYKKMVSPSIEAYGGRFIIRGGKAELLEGTTAPARLVVLQFESVERAKEWFKVHKGRLAFDENRRRYRLVEATSER